MAKVTITTKQAEQFNSMRTALQRLAKGYRTTDQLRKDSKGEYGLDYEEALEMAYENMQTDAGSSVKGIKAIKIN